MGLTLEEALARVPFFANAEELKSAPLTGGITNLNYKVEADGKPYVLRITGADTELLGISRDVEYAANLAAGKLGVAPEVVYFIEPEGYLVTRFIDGKRIPPDEIIKPENIRRVARKLRVFHKNGPELKAEFNVFRRIEMLSDVSRRYSSEFPFDFDWIMQKVHETEQALLKDHYTPTPCHDDLLNLNFLDEEVPGEIGEMRLLDWEYAGMGDTFFDLGNFSHHHRLNDELMRLLLQEYFGDVTDKNFARLKLMSAMSEIHEAMWGTTQTGISTLEEDFQGYADLWFGRAREDMTDLRWDRWLKDIK
ncbi:MAG TPA: choline/ethanolamine kinase family protein [Anaerolineales bacterium]